MKEKLLAILGKIKILGFSSSLRIFTSTILILFLISNIAFAGALVRKKIQEKGAQKKVEETQNKQNTLIALEPIEKIEKNTDESTPTQTNPITSATGENTNTSSSATNNAASQNTQSSDAGENSQSSDSSSPDNSSQSNSSSNSSSDYNQDSQEEEVDQTPPVIKHLGVEFGDYNAATGRAGAFDFNALDRKPFIGFADVVSSPTGDKTLPTFEYYVDSNATVYAISDSYVLTITYQADTQDYEIQTAKDKDGLNQYRIAYDHVKNLSISEGDQLTAGQAIGTAGTWDENIGRTEIMIYLGGQTVLAYCPFAFYDSSLKSAHESLVTNLIEDWETFKSDTNIYDESLYSYAAGCRSESMED